MEYVEGETWRSACGATALRSPSHRVLRIVAGRVEHVHWMGILHRDLKPQNIMLGFRGVVKLLDFA